MDWDGPAFDRWLTDEESFRGQEAHVFERSTSGTSMRCSKCGLVPLDQDDAESECSGELLD